VDARLLLVDDNPGDERLVREMLAATPGPSFVLESVDTLSKALDRLDANETDLVLLDLSLPDSTGIDTLSKVQARAPGVPIVVLTGSRDDELAIQSIRQGVQDYLLKGQVDAGILRLALHSSFERRRGNDLEPDRMRCAGTLPHDDSDPTRIHRIAQTHVEKDYWIHLLDCPASDIWGDACI